MVYYAYLILAVLFFIGEMFIMEFSLSCIGIGLLAAALTAALGGGIWWQAGAFIAAAVMAFIGVRPFALKYLYRHTKHVKTNTEALIGKEGVVETAIDPLQNAGRVKVEGENWKASARTPLPAGTPCIVEKLEGVTLFVKPK